MRLSTPVDPRFQIDPDGVLRFAPWRSFTWLVHGFQTRHATSIPSDLPIATVRQIHSAIIVRAEDGPGHKGDGDALVTSRPGLLLSVRTADCIPLLIVEPHLRLVAAVHAGWRGVVAEVAPHTLEVLSSHYSASPSTLEVLIGPCIRTHSFEVGPEVASQFAAIFPERPDLHQKTRLDLAEAITRQLVSCRVAREQIADCGLCTFAGAATFHSFRRDRDASGRMQSFVGITS